jgi:hypothetical protein
MLASQASLECNIENSNAWDFDGAGNQHTGYYIQTTTITELYN